MQKKYIAVALALVCLTGCSQKKNPNVYTSDDLLSAVGYDVDDYVKLPDLDNIHTTVTGDYRTTKRDIDRYINETLKNTKGLKKKTVKTLTNKECKKYLGYDTVDKYWQSVRDTYVKDNKAQLTLAKKDAVTEYLINKGKIKIPNGLVEKMTDSEISQYQKYAQSQGVTYKSYINTVYKYKDAGKFRKHVEEEQLKNARNNLVQQALIRETDYELKKSDFKKFVKQYCRAYSMKEKNVYKTYGSKKKLMLVYAQNDAIAKLTKKAKIKVINKKGS